MPEPARRRHDLDWIRVLAFGLLIPFHAAICFVDWNIFAYRNNDTSRLLQIPLIFVREWRLPLLFVISGMGTRFALSRRSGPRFVWERFTRLVIPLVFGVNAVVIVQAYYAALHQGSADGFWPFALGWWTSFGEVQHLWFILWLFGYSLVAAPVLVYFRNHPQSSLENALRRTIAAPFGLGLLLLLPLPLVALEWTLKPWAPGPMGGYLAPWYFVFFLYGFLLICVQDALWPALKRLRYALLAVGVATFALLFTGIVIAAEHRPPGYAARLLNGGWAQHQTRPFAPALLVFSTLHAINAWVWCLIAFAWGARFLDHPSRALTYCNQAVYPLYLVHLPFTLVAVYYVKDWALWWPLKLAGVCAVTLLGSWLVFELAKRTPPTRLLFGIKPLPTPLPERECATSAAAQPESDSHTSAAPHPRTE